MFDVNCPIDTGLKEILPASMTSPFPSLTSISCTQVSHKLLKLNLKNSKDSFLY